MDRQPAALPRARQRVVTPFPGTVPGDAGQGPHARSLEVLRPPCGTCRQTSLQVWPARAPLNPPPPPRSRRLIPIEPAAPSRLHFPRFRALALLGRLPSARVDRASSRRPKTCTGPDLSMRSIDDADALNPGADLFEQLKVLLTYGFQIDSRLPSPIITPITISSTVRC
jgi:hypothetical protein